MSANGSGNHTRGPRPHIEIRNMEIDDVAEVFHLGERLFTAVDHPNLYRTWDEFEVAGLFISDYDYCFVAESDGVMVGFSLGTTIEKARSAWKYGYLIWLGVEERFQKYGVGEKLYRHMREVMEEDGVRIMLVDTQADNEPALKFFRKMGFRSPEKHVFLSLNLDQPRRPKKHGG